MTKPLLVFLAPLGCLLMLVFSSLTPFRMMMQISEMMEPGAQVADSTSLAVLGGLGAVLFGMGMMSLMLLKRKPSKIARGLLIITALVMVAGAVFISAGDWMLIAGFRKLATAESVEPIGFVNSFRLAKFPLLAGHVLLLAATATIAGAATMSMESSARISKLSVVIGAISLLWLLLMVFWGQSAIPSFSQTLGSESVEPSRLAGIINGALQSDLLAQGSVVGFAVATLVLAVSRRIELIQEQEPSTH